jgi:uncharacterized protein
VLALDRAAGGTVRHFDADGRLRVSRANISKAMVSPYQAEEIPGWVELGLDPRRTYRLLRHPAEIRRAASTFDGLPLLSTHRPVGADDHPRELVVGTVGTDVRWDAPYLTASIVVWDQRSIDAIESGGKRELSCGYRYVPVITPGIFRGQRFDGVMTQIEGNHVALVDVGRVRDCAL